MSDLKTFLETLFDPGQASCYATHTEAYRVMAAPQVGDTYFCINALDSKKDNKPTQIWHRTDLPRRADCNVTCLRNFLLEIDTEPLLKQRALVEDILPVTSVVYSGKQSYHFIISLTEPLPTIESYRAIAKRLMMAVPKADRSTKNPSRFSRLPGVRRPDTGLMQNLVRLEKRIPLEVLEAALPPAPKRGRLKLATESDSKAGLSPALIVGATSKPDEYMVEYGLSGRNAFFFWLGQRMADLEMEPAIKAKFVQIAYTNLRDASGFDLAEAAVAARVEI